ncbi:MAG: autotransporter domain-containing protein [Sphingopyxis sp.]|nr:autotransporter domain-containing protein [Sphingopyxis sp.]
MSPISKSRLLATSAIVGLSIVHPMSPAGAQEAFGIHNDQPETLEVVVAEDEVVEGDIIGVYADNGAVAIDNAGTIRGNGTDFGSIQQRPSGGVVIAQPDSTVTNSGTISGAANGVTTSYFFSEDEDGEDLPPAALASGTTVTNSGLIRGEAGSGVALIGGGDVVNSGTIQAFGGPGVQATGVVIAEFPEAIAEGVTGIGSITNTGSGLIEGRLFGALLSGGGTIDNEGTIRSTGTFNPATPNVSPFGVILTANANQPDRTATVNNSGTIGGFLGLLANQALDTAIINNNGLISGNQTAIIGLNSGELIVNNAEDGRILGNAAGIASNAGKLTVDNAGLIRSNNQMGINITTPGAVINNSGTIQGNGFGITTNPFQVSPGVSQERAINTTVTNSGTIIGVTNDAVRLVGGGTVTNSGFIHGVTPTQNGTDGVSIFASSGQDLSTFSATVINLLGGEIDGQRAGVVLSSGGTLENAGDISASQFGVLVQNGLGEQDRTGAITNTGYIAATAGNGIVGFGRLTEFKVTNSGEIIGGASDGIFASTLGDGSIVIHNAEGGTITGASSGIESDFGSLTLTNAGTIRGNGTNQGANAAPDAGVTIAGGVSTVTNSGTISGNRLGIITASHVNVDTDELESLATGTTVINSGSIIGENDDGVRLIGGGSVANSGEIRGLAGDFTDGISMFAFADQANEDYGAAVTNADGGEISGTRFGIILSGGGDVANAGDITGVVGGVFIQGTAINTNPDEDRSGLTARVVNSGTIIGTGPLNSLGATRNGYGVGFGSDMSTATLENRGTITSEQSAGVAHGSRADVTVTNSEDGVITGATAGVIADATGKLDLVNAGSIIGGQSGVVGDGLQRLIVDNSGTIRGNGTTDTFSRVDAGIAIGQPNSIVTNSGTISGAGTGISTFSAFDPNVNQTVTQTFGIDIVNSGTITGDSNDGIRLVGGGTVTNSGTIAGLVGLSADGIQMNIYNGQAPGTYEAVVNNAADGSIQGFRYGVIALGGGGSVTNAGDIAGNIGGVLVQGNNAVPGSTGSIVNSGTITATNGLGVGLAGNLATASLENSGTISGNAGALLNAGASTVANAAGGSIIGVQVGVTNNLTGTLTVTNAGTIAGTTGGGIFSAGQTTLVNSGTISGGNGTAVLLGAFDDSVTLKTGSVIDGAINAGDGFDTLTLDGTVLELTEAQQIGASTNFETLDVMGGYWSTNGFVGEFGAVTIAEGGALQVNEVDLGEDGFGSPIQTSAVTTNGLLVLNFGSDDTVSDLDDLTIDGTGQLQLIGDAVFTVDTANVAHTGGTIISNGGLVLTGLLNGDVKTEGNGYFELGAGGTEGSFAGNIVNDGRFVFNRSDDYDFLGAFSGSGILDKKGDSVLTFMGDYAFQGVTNILGGSVRIGGIIDPTTNFSLGEGGTLDITGTDQTIGGLEGDGGSSVVIGDSQLTVAQSGNTAFGGDISGNGSLIKDGEGTLNLTGDSTYTGPTTVNGGTLAVNGSIASPVTVNDGGTLGGNGEVGSTTIRDGGRITPGNSIGQLTVNGDLTFAAGSTYEVEVNAAGAADRLDATGAVTIANTARVAVLAENGTYSPRTDYVILTGAGITGTFGTVTSNLAFLNPLLRYGANSVTLSLYRNDIDFADVALGFNQASVASAVQALGPDNALFEAVLMQNAAMAQASFGDLSGEILASSISGLTDDSRHLRNALLGMRAPEESGAFVWGSAFGGWGDFDANRGNFAMKTDHKGLVAGFGFGGNGFAAALSAGIGGSDFRFGGRGDSADVDSKSLSAHATYGADGGLRGTVGVSYAWHKIDTSRAIGGALPGQSLASKRDADTLQIFGEIGYDIVTGKAAITPFARLAHVDTSSDAFSETGGSAALAVGKADQKTTFVSLGARAQLNADQPGFQPYISAAWNRALDDRGAPIVSRFVTGGPAFDIVGIQIPKNSAEVEAGFEFTTGQLRLGAAYTGTLASDRNTHGARVTARIAF